MLKKVLILLIMLVGIPVFAADNYLNSVVLTEVDGHINMILRTDSMTKIKKSVESPDKIMLTLKGTHQSGNINTIYKNISGVNGFIIQNDNNDLKIYFEASNASKSEIIVETPNSAPIKVVDYNTNIKLFWSLISILLFIMIALTSKNYSKHVIIQDKNKLIKEREISLYRKFQKEVSTLPASNYKLKGYRKHVLKGETIRSYESRFAKIGKI